MAIRNSKPMCRIGYKQQFPDKPFAAETANSMIQSTSVGALRTSEFVPLVALLMSLVALSVDAMLPALPVIGQDLGVQRPNGTQFVITALFVGLGVGQLIFGPLSDRFGRKPAIYTGLTVFMIGCLISQFAHFI